MATDEKEKISSNSHEIKEEDKKNLLSPPEESNLEFARNNIDPRIPDLSSFCIK